MDRSPLEASSRGAGVTFVSRIGRVTGERPLDYRDDTWVAAMALDSDGDLFGAGHSYFRESGNRETDVVTFRMRPGGDFVWSKRFRRSGLEIVTAIARTPDGIIVGGYASSTGARNWDVLLQTIQSNGEPGERAILDHNNVANEVRSLRVVPQGVLVAATTRVDGQEGAWVFLFSAAGEIVWQAVRAVPSTAMAITNEERVVAVGVEGGKVTGASLARAVGTTCGLMSIAL